VTVVPAATTAAAVRNLKPDGVFLPTVPGIRLPWDTQFETIRDLSDGTLPIFGICLGIKLIGLALAEKQSNCPMAIAAAIIQYVISQRGQVLITSQNHGFAVRGEPSGCRREVA